jgi:hypothetical protein
VVEHGVGSGDVLQPGEAPSVEQISDLLILAAIARAECHAEIDGVRMARIAAHLGLPSATRATRGLHPRISALVELGTVRQFRLLGAKVWGLTPGGRRRLARARRAGSLPKLAEAPQHREWRLSRIQATEEIELLYEELGGALAQAAELIATRGGGSEAWIELGDRLRKHCTKLAIAHHALHEWPEPDDERPDSAARRRRFNLAVKGL